MYGYIQSALTIELITRHGNLLIICGLRPPSKVAQDENIQITIAELFDILPPCVISLFIVIISERKQKAFQSLFYCYSEFRISPHQANNNNKFKKVKTSQYTVFSEPK